MLIYHHSTLSLRTKIQRSLLALEWLLPYKLEVSSSGTTFTHTIMKIGQMA